MTTNNKKADRCHFLWKVLTILCMLFYVYVHKISVEKNF